MRNVNTWTVFMVVIASFFACETDMAFAQNAPPQALSASMSGSPGASALGVGVVDAATIASTLNQPDLRGALVVQVVAGSPAEKAGIVNGDIIENVNGATVARASDLDVDLSGVVPDSKVQVGLIRREKPVWVTVQLIGAVGRATTAANHPANLVAGYVGKRLTIKIVENCPPDLDPLGFTGAADSQLDCDDEDTREAFRNAITAAFTAKDVFGQIGAANPDLILTVTVIQEDDDKGAAGFITDLIPGTFKVTAGYQLAGTAGGVVASGTVHQEGPDNEKSDADNGGLVVVRQLADKLATAVLGVAPSASTVAPVARNANPQPAPASPPAGDKRACTGSLFSCMAGH